MGNKQLFSQTIPNIDFATLDLLPYGIIITDKEGTILFYNSREEQIAGRKKEDVIGKNFFKEVAPCTQVKEFYGRFAEVMRLSDLTASFRFTFPFPKIPREVDITLTSFEYDYTNLCMISVNDVTEERLVRERILRAERLQEIGQVAASVAHNFNNLLSAVRGYAQLMLLKTPEDEKLHHYAQSIMKVTDDGISMVKRIRENTQVDPEKNVAQDSINLNSLINDSVMLTESYIEEERKRRGAEIKVELNLSSQLPHVHGNAGELREVAVNLIRNATDAIDCQGTIRLQTFVNGKWNIFEISDTGTGMSKEIQDKLFHPLFTTKGERGTGLGLSSSYAIIRRHSGEIDVKSEIGRGTKFIIRLPKISL